MPKPNYDYAAIISSYGKSYQSHRVTASAEMDTNQIAGMLGLQSEETFIKCMYMYERIAALYILYTMRCTLYSSIVAIVKIENWMG